jgi:hypothetical protein
LSFTSEQLQISTSRYHTSSTTEATQLEHIFIDQRSSTTIDMPRNLNSIEHSLQRHDAAVVLALIVFGQMAGLLFGLWYIFSSYQAQNTAM